MFDGYDRIRILTYSAGVGAIVRLLDKHGFSDFECVFGCESTLRTLKDIMAFQQVAIGDTRSAIQNYILFTGSYRFRMARPLPKPCSRSFKILSILSTSFSSASGVSKFFWSLQIFTKMSNSSSAL